MARLANRFAVVRLRGPLPVRSAPARFGAARLNTARLAPEIDLVVTDLTMPIVPGQKLIAELRAKPEFRELPVLVVSEHPGDLTPELRAGRTVVLRKPFELDDFMRWVNAAARLARPRN